MVLAPWRDEPCWTELRDRKSLCSGVVELDGVFSLLPFPL